MGGKKKKGLANRLAKMSDDERARYMQHKADLEEENKRRKEQLIATFMKKKIKKEEAFSRLNIAKINQEWHQILRKIKCKEMKEEVVHMKKSIELVLSNKNRTISKLLVELEESEEQYLHNFQAHVIHFDEIFLDQHDYMEKLKRQYKGDVQELIEESEEEVKIILNQFDEDIFFLKGIKNSQETSAEDLLKKDFGYYSLRSYEFKYSNHKKIGTLIKNRKQLVDGLWKQIAQVIRLFVQKTDLNRMHLGELKRLDKEGSEEIFKNALKIQEEESLICKLTEDLEVVKLDNQEALDKLKREEKKVSSALLFLKQKLHKNLLKDEKKLEFLGGSSNEALDHLKAILKKGNKIVELTKLCSKLETNEEVVRRFLPEPTLDLEEDEEQSEIETFLSVEFQKRSWEPEPFKNDILEGTFQNLTVLEKFWRQIGKTEHDFQELKLEKLNLIKENDFIKQQLRVLIEMSLLERIKQKNHRKVFGQTKIDCGGVLNRLK